jgi:putative hemolysin
LSATNPQKVVAPFCFKFTFAAVIDLRRYTSLKQRPHLALVLVVVLIMQAGVSVLVEQGKFSVGQSAVISSNVTSLCVNSGPELGAPKHSSGVECLLCAMSDGRGWQFLATPAPTQLIILLRPESTSHPRYTAQDAPLPFDTPDWLSSRTSRGPPSA